MRQTKLFPLLLLLAIGLLQGCAEKFPQTYQYDQAYTLPYDVSTTLKRLEQLDREAKFKNPALSVDTDRANHFGDFDGERLYFRHYGETTKFDTVKVFDQNGDTIPGDPYDLVEKRAVRLDSHYLSPEGYLTFYFWPEKAAGCYEIRALLKLMAQDTGSRLDLEKIRVGACGVDIDTGEEKMKEFILKTFEERVMAPVNPPSS